MTLSERLFQQTCAEGRFPSQSVGDTSLACQTWTMGFGAPKSRHSPAGGIDFASLGWGLAHDTSCGPAKSAYSKEGRVGRRQQTVPRNPLKAIVESGLTHWDNLLWNNLLQSLLLRDAGPLAAVSQACLAQLQPDLAVAAKKDRRCIFCSQSFKYLTGSGECRYHPGQEKITLVGDSPAAGFMDVSFSCCGKGATYAVGLGMPCSDGEVPGCQVRSHRAKPQAVRQSTGSCGRCDGGSFQA